MKFLHLLLVSILLGGASQLARAELADQGLNSIMQIIDKAIDRLNAPPVAGEDEAATEAAVANAATTVVNLSRTLGTLSYSRLQCGEAGVLAEFTQRVQRVPEVNRDAMRDAFQEGFDQSKDETELLSEDECERLTRSRERAETAAEANVNEEAKNERGEEPQAAPVEDVEPAEDPKLRHLRIAELSGQLAYKRRFCQNDKVFNRDYNTFIASVPEEYLEEVKTAYWKGYQRGKRLNKELTREHCGPLS